MSRPRQKSNWKRVLWVTVGSIFLLSVLATFEVTVLLPRRLEHERQARRDAPPRLIPPGQRGIDEGEEALERSLLTAFRVADWRPKPESIPDLLVWNGEPEDVYLGGYLAFQEGQKLIEGGDLAAGRKKFELAAKVFAMIQERRPDYEPAMVDYRRRKIAELLSELAPESPDTGSL
ncbi:MAG: hypothetical protein ACR2RV_15225 [Verrucomicrobiales bacterium]